MKVSIECRVEASDKRDVFQWLRLTLLVVLEEERPLARVERGRDGGRLDREVLGGLSVLGGHLGVVIMYRMLGADFVKDYDALDGPRKDVVLEEGVFDVRGYRLVLGVCSYCAVAGCQLGTVAV